MAAVVRPTLEVAGAAVVHPSLEVAGVAEAEAHHPCRVGMVVAAAAVGEHCLPSQAA